VPEDALSSTKYSLDAFFSLLLGGSTFNYPKDLTLPPFSASSFPRLLSREYIYKPPPFIHYLRFHPHQGSGHHGNFFPPHRTQPTPYDGCKRRPLPLALRKFSPSLPMLSPLVLLLVFHTLLTVGHLKTLSSSFPPFPPRDAARCLALRNRFFLAWTSLVDSFFFRWNN